MKATMTAVGKYGPYRKHWVKLGQDGRFLRGNIYTREETASELSQEQVTELTAMTEGKFIIEVAS